LFAHLSLILVAGIYIPGPVATWFQNVAVLIG
jgi:hydrogenase-4 component F